VGGRGPDEELTVDYGESFWETVRLHDAVRTFTLVAQRQSPVAALVDALARL
jgi:hypothetical protein